MSEKQTEKTKEKSRWRRWLLFGIPAIAMSAALLPVAAAWNGWIGHGHCLRGQGGFSPSNADFKQHMDRHLSMVFDVLDATDEQQTAIRKIVEESSDELMELHAKGHALRETFTQALLAQPIDRQRLDALRGELQVLTDRFSELVVEQLSAISEQLTEEQREKVRYYIGVEHGYH